MKRSQIVRTKLDRDASEHFVWTRIQSKRESVLKNLSITNNILFPQRTFEIQENLLWHSYLYIELFSFIIEGEITF